MNGIDNVNGIPTESVWVNENTLVVTSKVHNTMGYNNLNVGNTPTFGSTFTPSTGWQVLENTYLKAMNSDITKMSVLATALPSSTRLFPFNGNWGLTINIGPVKTLIDSVLTKAASDISKVLPLTGRLAGLTLGLLWPSSLGSATINPSFNNLEQQLLVNKAIKDGIQNQGVTVVTLPLPVVTGKSAAEVKNSAHILPDLVVHSAVDTDKKTVETILMPGNSVIPVLKAKKGNAPGRYAVQIIPGMPELHIQLENKPMSTELTVTSPAKPSLFLPTPSPNTTDAIIDFGDDYPPLYISVSHVVNLEHQKALVEEALRRHKELQSRSDLVVAQDALAEAVVKLATANINVLNAQKHFERNRTDIPAAQAKIAELRKKAKAYSSGGFMPHNSPVTAILNEISKIDATINKHQQAESGVSVALAAQKDAEGKKKAAEDKVKAEQDKKRQGVKDKGHGYHPAPKTEEIKGLGELKKGQKKTPKQGGGGKRDRWIGEKGRKIYEWDSQHGELEGYRASDGQHIGAFDPKTGKQLKPADPKRNIKKYL